MQKHCDVLTKFPSNSRGVLTTICRANPAIYRTNFEDLKIDAIFEACQRTTIKFYTVVILVMFYQCKIYTRTKIILLKLVPSLNLKIFDGIYFSKFLESNCNRITKFLVISLRVDGYLLFYSNIQTQIK